MTQTELSPKDAFDSIEYRPGLYLLSYRNVAQPSKVVLFFHGGGWFAGDPLQFTPQCAVLARHGVAGVTATYRVYARHRTMVHDAISDAVAATAHLQEMHPKLLTFLCGASAGGLLAIHAAVAAKSPVSGLILFNPVLDLSSEGFKNHAVPEGGDQGISPLHMTKAGLPPVLLMQGTHDAVTPMADAQCYVSAIKTAGGNATLATYPGGHGFFNLPRFLESTTSTLERFISSIGS